MRRQVRPFHLRVRHRVPIPGHRLRLRRGPRLRLPGPRGERQARAGRADQLGAVAIGQRPGHERPGPVAARDPPADLERLPAGPPPDREHPDIERTHAKSSPCRRREPHDPSPTTRRTSRLRMPLPQSGTRPALSAGPRPEATRRSRPGARPAVSLARFTEPPSAGCHIRHHRPAMTTATRPSAVNIATYGNRGRDATSPKYSQIAEYVPLCQWLAAGLSASRFPVMRGDDREESEPPPVRRRRGNR